MIGTNEITSAPNRPRVSTQNWRRVLYLVIAGLVVFFDQWTKAIIDRTVPPFTIVPVIPNFFNLTDTRNPGAAFGMLSNSPAEWKTVLLIVISLLLLIAILVFVLKSRYVAALTGVALGLILGGAASNLVDRMRFGQVTDFLDFYFRSYHWYTFNLADSAIVAGAILLLIGLWVTP